MTRLSTFPAIPGAHVVAEPRPCPPTRIRPSRYAAVAAATALLAGGALLLAAGPAAAAPAASLVRAAAAEGQGPDSAVRSVAALAGYVAYGLMALTVAWGILTTTGLARGKVNRRTIFAGHTALALTTISFSLLHAVTYMFQQEETFSIFKTFIPFVQGGEIEVALGIVGLELAIGVTASIVIQRKLNYRRWHKVHYAAYAAFVLSLAHTLATSPEARTPGLVGITVLAAALVCVALFVLRVLPATREDAARLPVRELV